MKVGVAGAMLMASCAPNACAQASPTATGPGSYISAGVGFSAYQADYGHQVLDGAVAFVDVHPTWRYGIEGEARSLRIHSSENVTVSMFLAGAHVYLKDGKIRPYAKFLAGGAIINLPFRYARGTFFAYAPGAGVDLILNERLSLRLVDVEYQTWPQFTYGNLYPYGISTGIVFRLNRVAHFPKR